MQTTPFKNVQHHTDGRHVFTVTAGEERKQFVTTANISTEQALTNALKWRDSQTGIPLAEADHPKIRWFVSSLDDPSLDFIASMRKPTPSPEPRRLIIPEHLKQKVTGNVIASSGTPPPPTSPVTERSRRFPSLPLGVSPHVSRYSNGNSPSVVFLVNYHLNGKATSRKFYLGTIYNVTLAKYRAVRHVAIKFREEYLNAKAQKREMDLEAFVGYYEKLRNNTFRWPFAGTVPTKMSTFVKERKLRGDRAPNSRQTQRMEGKNPKHPSLPLGVTLGRTCKEGKTDQIFFHINYTDNRNKPARKSYYVCLVGNLSLRRYRMVRHVAIAFRKEYLDARVSRRPMRMDLFEDWKEKIMVGVFFVPFTKLLPDAEYNRTQLELFAEIDLLKTRAGLTARDIVDTLKGVPEIRDLLENLPKARLDQIALLIRNPIHEAIYLHQKK